MKPTHVAEAISFGTGYSGEQKPLVTVTPDDILVLLQHSQAKVPELADKAEAAVAEAWTGGGSDIMEDAICEVLVDIAAEADRRFQKMLEETE